MKNIRTGSIITKYNIYYNCLLLYCDTLLTSTKLNLITSYIIHILAFNRCSITLLKNKR